MIVRAALCPSPPLLASGVTGQDVLLPELRDACAAAVAWLLAADPDTVAVIGPATATDDLAARQRARPVDARPGRVPGAFGASPGPRDRGAVPRRGRLLAAPASSQSVAESASSGACLELGRELAAAAPRVALLVMGDGSARRSAAAPGYLDDRAEPFDAAVEQAFRGGDLSALTALDPDLARDLLASGRPAWQALAGACLPAPHPQTEILYSAAPFGVAYLVATLTPAP